MMIAKMSLAFMLILSSQARADTIPAPTSFQGRLVESFDGRHQFAFTAPAQRECQASHADPIFKTYHCQFPHTGASAILDGGAATALSFTFTNYILSVKSLRSGWVHQFDYQGIYTQADGVIPLNTPINLTAWYYATKPQELHVKWSIPSFGISRFFDATPTSTTISPEAP